MTVVANEFRDECPIKSDTDARDLWRIAVMQHASWVAGMRHARYEAATRNRV